MKLPAWWTNKDLVERIKNDPGAMNVVSRLADTESATFAGSPCSGLLVEHLDGSEECTFSTDCRGGKVRHHMQSSCAIFPSCAVCAA